MQLIAGSKSKRGALDCNHGGLREQEPAQPVAEGVQGAAGDGDASQCGLDSLHFASQNPYLLFDIGPARASAVQVYYSISGAHCRAGRGLKSRRSLSSRLFIKV